MCVRPIGFALALLLAGVSLHATGLHTRVEDPSGQSIAEAVVSLVPLDHPAPPANTPAPRIEIAQQGEEYRPKVSAVRVGTVVDFPNKDDVQHHLYSVSKPKPFEKPFYGPGASESVLFDQPGVVVLGCNIHDWMSAYVVVVDTPHFAITDTAGRADFADLPPGRYRIDLWHGRLAAPQNREITLGASDTQSETFTVRLRPDRRVRRAPGSDARTY